MHKKLLIDLTKSDILNEQVWEHWTENNIEYVKPIGKGKISKTNSLGFIIKTEFLLNNKSKLIGFCSPQDISGLDYVQPVIFTENGQVELWKDNGWTKEEKVKALQKLEIDWDEVFPITYQTLIKYDDVYYQGTLLDFNKGK